MQHWINDKGKITYLNKQCYFNWSYIDLWKDSTKIEVVKLSSESKIYRNQITPTKYHPNKKILPILKRNGFKGNFHGKTPIEFLQSIILNPQIETLLKQQRFDLIKHLSPKQINSFWPQIKIALRMNYYPSSCSDWVDYLKLTQELNKDIRLIDLVCPDNLEKQHQKYLEKYRIRQKKIKLEQLKAQITEFNLKYSEIRNQYFDIQFSSKTIDIKVLSDVKEFYNESETLKHCLFENKYFLKEESLILSARINNMPVETIELSLKDFKIIQSRGFENKPTKYHKEIIELVHSNIKHIRMIHLKKQSA